MTYIPTPTETERRNRIRLSVAAYSYEFYSDSVMTDAEFDSLSLRINKDLPTGNSLLDQFFRENFSVHTGMWIHDHPEKEKLDWLYKNVYKKKKKRAKKVVDTQENTMYSWYGAKKGMFDGPQ